MNRYAMTAEYIPADKEESITRMFSPLVRSKIRAYEYVFAILTRRGCTNIKFKT